jgi:hypothetical protein
MEYSVISVNTSRQKNVENIYKIFGEKDLAIKSYNGKNSEDRDVFSEANPEVDFSFYAVKPVVPVSPDRKLGEIGCWMSHYERWKYLVANNLDGLLVLEDDCFVDENVAASIKELVKYGHDLIMLGNWTEAVYVTKAGAEWLLKNASDLLQQGPIDEVLMQTVRLTGMSVVAGWDIIKAAKFPITRQLMETYPSEISS